MKRLFKEIVISCLFVLIFAGVLIYNEETPTVYFSYETDHCVKVVPFKDNQNCEVMPSKYHHAWVR